MSKIKSLFLGCAVAFCTLCAIVFAGCGYIPEEGKKYFKVDDICRVIELDESKTRTIEDYGIEVLFNPDEPSSGFGNSAIIQFDHYFFKNSLFFKSAESVSAPAAVCVYDYLGMDKYPALTDEYYETASDGSLYTVNELYKTDMEVHGFKEWDQPHGVVYGFVSDVTEYTFNFVDYDKRGNEVESGTFTVMLCTETPHEDFFEISVN